MRAVHTALVGHGAHHHAIGMFVVTEADAAAIRDVFDQEGELSAAIELRRRFPGITDNAKARACARTIAGWKPPPAPPSPVTWLRPRRKDPLPAQRSYFARDGRRRIAEPPPVAATRRRFHASGAPIAAA